LTAIRQQQAVVTNGPVAATTQLPSAAASAS
jgi:hypothetical protein